MEVIRDSLQGEDEGISKVTLFKEKYEAELEFGIDFICRLIQGLNRLGGGGGRGVWKSWKSTANAMVQSP